VKPTKKPGAVRADDAETCGSDLDVTEIAQNNKTVMPIRKKVVRVTK